MQDQVTRLRSSMSQSWPEKACRSWVSADALLLSSLESSLTMPDSIGSFQVDALDIQLEITAEGQIGLLGTGGKLGGKGSLTLRLKCPNSPKPLRKKTSAAA
ncbi:Pepco domain-containing protein [Bradyrhizobium zhengyangense]|uniref:Pepco domain-containing protein n=1 Tax=Bradyrhizobium zhengyangense TaxID=2911009 RepID=UPI003B846427